jgi:glutathione synthase/RimK-type ligase-like ATP-grasp enzyme
VLNQRCVADLGIDVDIEDGQVTGELRLGHAKVRLEDVEAVYIRLMDQRLLPEVQSALPGSALAAHSERVHDVLFQWCEVTSARVINRLAPMSSNASKPYQAQLVAEHGFAVPETLITNEPDVVRDFVTRHKDVIYKSMSGVRSIVQRVQAEDLSRLERIRWCPVQFQAAVKGRDVRVHCLGQEVFATAVDCGAVDYRYASRTGWPPARLSAFELDDDVAERCVKVTAALGLAFAGIDLRLTHDGEVYCFEVNPCPGYSYYECNTGQRISLALARHLTGRAFHGEAN